MSYMGQRYVGGGGQIFPNNQNQSFQPLQRQYQAQVMQMQYQLQQKLQNQMQNKQQGNANARNNDFNKGNNKPNSGPPNQNKPDTNQSNNLNNRPNVNQRQPNAAAKGNDPKPVQNERKPDTQNQNANTKGKEVGNTQAAAKPNATQENKDKNISPQKDVKPSPGALNDKGLNKPQFGNKPPGNQPNQQSGSLLGRPPPPPPPPLQNTAPQQVKQETDQSMNRGQQNQNFNRYNQNSDSYEGQNQGRQNPQDRGPYGRGPRGAPKAAPANNDNYYNRSGRNMNAGGGGGATANSNDFRSNQNRGSQQTGNYSGGAGYKGPRNYYGMDKLKERVLQMFSGPLVDLPPLDTSEKKFNAYAKLFIGNIAKNTEQEELVALFEKYGEIGQVYLNKESSFAFIHFDYKANASKAMRELDNTLFKNRYLKVRFSTINEGIRIKNISPYVSNELLEKAFSVFGMIESCKVVADDRGGSKGEGIILFRDKKAAVLAIKKCQEECFFLSGALRPVVVSALEPSEENVDGVPETSLPKNDEYQSERNITPHFADSGTFEYDFGVQWKQLYNMYDEKKAILDRDFQIEIDRLEKKMVLAKVEYETEKLRKELAQREAESAHLRRHFDIGDGMGGSSGIGAQPAPPTANYDNYNNSKRPLDQAYDTPLNGPYDRPPATYTDNYDRAAYPPRPAEYERGYDQNYAAGYGREDYRRDASGYGREDPYERANYDRPGEMPQDRPLFDTPAGEQAYPENPADPKRVNDPYKAPSKRPRY